MAYSAGAAPMITTDAAGLPHCTRCADDTALCRYHRAQVATAPGTLKTAGLFTRSESGLRHLPRHLARDDD